MKAAVVQYDTNIVLNIILAYVTDVPPEPNCFLVSADDVPCNIGWIYDPITGTFYDPNPPPAAEEGI